MFSEHVLSMFCEHVLSMFSQHVLSMFCEHVFGACFEHVLRACFRGMFSAVCCPLDHAPRMSRLDSRVCPGSLWSRAGTPDDYDKYLMQFLAQVR
jgi:hypothetical protein